MAKNSILSDIFKTLLNRYGHRHWWPGETAFEVCVGAILTQNTNWSNVEKAIENLKKAGLLTVEGFSGITKDELALMIRPAGYFNVKAQRLLDFVNFLKNKHNNNIDLLFANRWQETRNELLSVRGIGPETADSILLYAGNKPSFVVDAYTRRIFSRLGLVEEGICYDDLRIFFMERLPQDTTLFNEYHALIVQLGKENCRSKPRCSDCCLLNCCQTGRTQT